MTVALVTGCSSGIGRAAALRLQRSGTTTVATARWLGSMTELAEAGCTVLPLDVTDDASRRACVEQVQDLHGSVDVLVNNAGYAEMGPVEQVPLDAWRRQLETNVLGPVALAQLVLPGMRRAGRGRIVNVSSMGGEVTFPGGGAYHASKYALEALSDALRVEVRPFGVGVVLVQPGPVATAFGDNAADLTVYEQGPYGGLARAMDKAIREQTPRGSSPDAVARVVVKAATTRRPQARYRVGTTSRGLVFGRRLMTDRTWDAIMRSQFRDPAPSPSSGATADCRTAVRPARHERTNPMDLTHGRTPTVLRYAAFTRDPSGGNPAGVVLNAEHMTAEQMLATAADVGCSETAFLVPRGGRAAVRYFSPLAEVSFCGHATIASAVAYAERHGAGTLVFETGMGPVEVLTEQSPDGVWLATLTSVPPRTVDLAPADLARLLSALRWSADDLDPGLPPRAAYAGAWHPVVAARSRQRLADLDYDMAELGDLMQEKGWTTVDLVWRESATVFHARNPFPPGGVVEDPATGAAAAALGGYLRDGGLVELPATVLVRQGNDMGRPSVLTVVVPDEAGSGIRVTGSAVPLPAGP